MTGTMDRISQVLTDKPTLLIVDDEPSHQCLLALLLEAYGYRVLLADNGVEARAAMEVTEVALILCDVQLRGESGLTLIQEILRQSPHTVALTMSEGNVPDQAPGAGDERIYGHIVKPVDAKDVGNRIAQALCGRSLGGAPVQRDDTFPWQQRREFTNA